MFSKIKLSLFIICLMLSGCDNAPKTEISPRVDLIQEGMTEKEVLEILGHPRSESTDIGHLIRSLSSCKSRINSLISVFGQKDYLLSSLQRIDNILNSSDYMQQEFKEVIYQVTEKPQGMEENVYYKHLSYINGKLFTVCKIESD
ncbi:hypothetical protein [Zophobihabitans entericus]|uniref:Lipoprotein n=1 Tax=Zophobihabitans entericus TaxID=1635327 RepID=A0A6G9I7T5_9GAMM|nr:hypothetical protein [Zophobihabitans entericus]QIQ20266.1 hypothetical protein IPMB12_00370 [Zophobihabitans entericus]